jgi:arginase
VADPGALKVGGFAFSDREIGMLGELVPLLQDSCDKLAEYNIPPSIEHGDFAAFNIIKTPDGFVFLDWSEASVTHPFLGTIAFSERAEGYGVDLTQLRETQWDNVEDAYLTPWEQFEPRQRLHQAFALARPLSALHYALSSKLFVLPSIEARWEEENMFVYYARMVLKYGEWQMKRSKFEVIGAPFDLCSTQRGSAAAPAVRRENGLMRRLGSLKRAGISVVDGGDVASPEAGDETARPKRLSELLAFSSDLMSRLKRSYESGHTPVVLGGDHSVSIPSVSAAAAYLRSREGENAELGLLVVDAHADLETPQASPDDDLHAMSAAHIIGYGIDDLRTLGGFCPKVRPESIVYIGLRDVYPNERKILKDERLTAYTMSDIERLGIVGVCERAFSHLSQRTSAYVLSLDADAIDPKDAPGVLWPTLGGLSYREASVLMEFVSASEDLLCVEAVEFVPAKDRDSVTSEALTELLRTALGGVIL